MQRSKSTPNLFSIINSSPSSNKLTRYIHGYTPIDKTRELHENMFCYTVLSNVEFQIEKLETLINDTMCVNEIYRFRFDKDKIWVYKCNKSLPFDISKVPKCPLDAPSYSHDWLPDKYWPMYLNACQFMTRVRSETPKITLYTPTSKAVLYDLPGLYEVLFFADSTRVIFNNGIRIVKSTGIEFLKTKNFSYIFVVSYFLSKMNTYIFVCFYKRK